MFVAGTIDESAKKLLQTTYDCWILACQFVAPGNDYKDIGSIIEDHVTAQGFTTVRNFCGHGIGSTFHTNPNILHYRNNEPNGQMAIGHTFTIEPMICEGTFKHVSWMDNWTGTLLSFLHFSCRCLSILHSYFHDCIMILKQLRLTANARHNSNTPFSLPRTVSKL